MAKKRKVPSPTNIETRSFQKGMVKNLNDSIIPDGAYLHARNAINNSQIGDLGVIGNEPSNKFCANAPYTIIGTIHMYGDIWAIMSTDNTNSEIGSFDESSCTYTTIVNDPCLGFKKTNPILGGEAKENSDCTWQVYFADNLNPDRSINMNKPPWIQNCINIDGCIECTDTKSLDCERLRMARLTSMPCLRIEQASNGGELLNGTYQAVIAYTENEQRITDYSIPSNIVSLFDHNNVNGSLDIIIESIDQTYDEFELVVIGFVNQQLVARRIGIYSTHQGRISLDKIDPKLPAVPLQFIPIDRPSYERSEGIYRNGEYLIRVAPTSRFSFNYQPIANNIITKWVSVEYPEDYYRKAGSDIGYMRDEVYPFFIRWIYNTNDKSESYHIPGRPPMIHQVSQIFETSGSSSPAYGSGLYFEEFNTATQTSGVGGTTSNGGQIIGKGLMSYWESSELYPDNKPDVWGNLCGQPIRHHKMPDASSVPGAGQHFSSNGTIKVLGVEFSNIAPPVDNNNIPIPGIIGYEILRGSREGNKTVIAKGLLNNMGAYDRADNNGIAYYQNYPYNDLRTDPFLNATDFITGDNDNQPGKPHLGGLLMQRDKFTFHSPDTQFKHPFLSAKEVKIYETQAGPVEGVFVEPYKHPEHKLVTDMAFILAGLVGFGIALKSIQGVPRSTRKTASVDESIFVGPAGTNGAGVAIGIAAAIPHQAALAIENAATISGSNALLALTTGTTGEMTPGNIASYVTQLFTANVQGVSQTGSTEFSTTGETGMPFPLAMAQAIPTFLAYWSEGTQAFIDIIQAMSRKHQYALAYQSHAFHRNTITNNSGFRAGINNSSYISDKLQEFGGITVNNLYRGACVALTTNSNVPDPAVQDTSRQTFKQAFGNTVLSSNIDKKRIIGNASSHYVGLKQRIRNQYGQIDGIKQVPTGSCMQNLTVDPSDPNKYISDVIFGGDIYIGRYTEKNTFFYFFDWLLDLPDEFEYDYRLRKMMPYPTYWMDTHDFQVSDFLTGIFDTLFNVGGAGILPTSWHNFDTTGNFGFSTLLPSNPTNPVAALQLMKFIVKEAYMYLFNSGVRDFYVESEVNIAYRDWGEEPTQKHYDPFSNTSLEDLFRADRVRSNNFFKYDYSLSTSRYYQGYPSWGSMQYRNYDPLIAETCYTHYPNRVIYSLPQNKELRYDNWLAYLINNYKDFTSRVTTIKPIGKNGAMILFQTEAPSLIPGVDVLETESGTKITIGDGGLFSQPLQNLVNTDDSYEYGSCQDRLSVINTPAGLFWISQNQGKIFNYTGTLEDISQQNMKWWFDEFLPYKILEDFPNFQLTDNTIIGVGCQSIYDNSYGLIYFTKRDFKLRYEYIGQVSYLGDDNFLIGRAGIAKLGDPRYFDDASWTISYDPKSKSWVSFHDWHPNFMMPSKNNFLTIANRGIWKHNDRSDSFCNYYGQNYPFEVELVTPTGQTVNTLKSIEYQMEVFQWGLNGIDRNHVLDFNFDRVVVYNTEQISGELRLNISPKNNAPDMLNYPRVNPSSIDILYSKEEQKYRFNQFWDITDDRGEFTNARRMMWETEPNGYVKSINPLYVNYNKPLHQRKKFRHYQSNLLLRRQVSGPHNMMLKLVNSKNQYSAR